ncbi:TetR/AcrR family transcriptional regulator [Myroides marinus]|uniref:TetR family transcriptional regulator n=1 Tax=Myroides marinus TaxID=703342 RepID=A0A161SHJ2_9FLAO|nr:TetR/AcrR family transcriptional regulator [Myroides marinus]KUF43490.1 TetR family transcriptional regulator [Myroides marinus]KZE80945.1 TetR family transcriptional regulator [Myroides marinus]MDM1377797.1 TetR/AcrR family transcriptional regulator [Myroides marinus]MDM1384999.1 TetR/AcrR family transcriptional regulator [Myroides marinus]MDM1392281.1 TetR/AcrR family transcriptional regulator [Myroides marinus]
MALSDKQKEILLIAEELFSQKGIDGTSIREISKAAGINVAMVNYYFGSKSAMVSALFEIRLTRTREKLVTLTDDTNLNPMDKLLAFVEHMMAVQLQNADFHIILMNQLSKKENAPEITEGITLLQREILQNINGFIEEGYSSGLFQAKPDPITFVIFALGIISYLIHHERTLTNYWNINNREEYSEHIKLHVYPYLIQSFKSILIYNEQK